MIQILKDGFAVVIWRNPDYMKMFDRDPHRKSPADGHTFELEPFKGTVEAYADNLRALNVGLTFLTWSQHCEWNPHTDMVGELDRITKRLASREVRSPFPRAAELAVYPGCAEAMNRLRSAQ
jgi:hypothetical protein